MCYLVQGACRGSALCLAQARLCASLTFCVIKDKVDETSHILVQAQLIDAEFRKAWMPYFCRSGHPVVTVEQFLEFVDPFIPQEPILDLPRITGQDLFEVARAKSPRRVGWMGGPGMKLSLFPWHGFPGLPISLI